MKKLLLSFSLLLALSLQVNAQTTTMLGNPGLENWVPVFQSNNGAEEPSGWLTPNLLTSDFYLPGNTNPECVEKVSGAGEVTEGTYAMKITTIDVNQNPYPEYIPNTGGIAFIGAPELIGSDIVLRVGFEVQNFEPAAFAFDAKYAPNGTDTAFCNVVLTHYNTGTNKRDTVAYALDTIKVAVSAYQEFAKALYYVPALTGTLADTCMIAFSSSSRHVPVAGSVLHVDDLVFTFTTGTKASLSEDGFMVYPNPTNDKLVISGLSGNKASKVEVLNAEGILTLSEELNTTTSSISTVTLESGIYHLQILNENGEVISRKKFSVVK